jgi:tRNA (mo5U34)-methyltransferase
VGVLPDFGPLFAAFPGWERLAPEVSERTLSRHGDYARWLEALEALPALEADTVSLGATVRAAGPAGDEDRQLLEAALKGLHPWRKGPFELFGVHIDSEWRSDFKWQRLAPALGSLEGERVLDVGCGNGYFGWRALEAGAGLVVGVDPSILFFLQHLAVCRYLGGERNWLLPVAFEALPDASFDAVLSMGVLYHRREPFEHLERLLRFLRPGGRLVLETLVVDGAQGLRITGGRYARMRNVHLLASVSELVGWLERAGLEDVQLVDRTATTADEQRSTPWMRFQSLSDALDPDDPTRTVEGHPAPLRAIVIARRGSP